MKWLLVCLFVVLPAFAQVKRGSVGVVYLTNDKIIVAADSRGTTRVASRVLHSDDECKVAALGGDVLFVSTGATAFNSTLSLVPSWSNLNEAHIAYQHVISRYHNARGHLHDIADDWASSIRSKWATLTVYDRATVEKAVTESGLTIALIGGRDSAGVLQVIQVTITFEFISVGDPVGTDIKSAPCSLRNFCAVGEIAIPLEFLVGITDRAKEESRTWAPGRSVAAPDGDIARAIRLVQLTIKYHGGDVGGPVDAVQLGRTAKARWYRRKSNCPAN